MLALVAATILGIVASPLARAGASEETLLLRAPTVSARHVAFVYAGDVWVVGREGGEARRLTVHPGMESAPRFSPDGKWIAFSGNYDGNVDVYVVPVEGGAPTRLTWHPMPDIVRGWTPDGSKIVFASLRLASGFRSMRHFTVPREGGIPEALILPQAQLGTFSPDGTKYAYTPVGDAFGTWKRYRGGRMSKIWIFDFATQETEEIPRDRANDTSPMWIGRTIYFLSDRDHTMNLFAFDTETKEVRAVTRHTDYDVKSASAGAGVIVYERRGRIFLHDPASGKTEALSIRCGADLPDVRPHWVDATRWIRGFGISPTGVRAVFEARGEILTVPAEKGDIRNLTRSPGVHDRDPAWSPDGKWIAFFSDASGEYKLHLVDQAREEPVRTYSLGDPTFYYSPIWSPDSKKIAFTDKRLRLSIFDLEGEETVLVDTDTYDHPERTLDPSWSPDSRWLAYTKRLDNHLHAVFLHDVESQANHQVTDGMSDARSPRFSRDGKYLFFAASTDFGLNTGWLDMSSYERPIRSSLYVAVLDPQEESPFRKESDEEKVTEKDEKKEEAKEEETEKEEGTKDEGEKKVDAGEGKARVALEGIDQRILALPVPPGTYGNLETAADGKLFYVEASPSEPPTLRVFDMKERKSSEFLGGIGAYAVSHDGKKLLWASGRSFGIVATSGKPSPGQGKLDLGSMQVHVDPRAEWNEIYDEAWRINRDFFYDPGMHGANWAAVRERYRPLLEHVGHRSDLNYVLAEMIGELVVGHAYVGGGDAPETETVPGGLLGCDFEIADGYYRIAKIYSGHNWNPDLRAPLTEPGVRVSEGDYLLAVNGRPLRAPTSVYALLEGTAGKITEILVNGEPKEEGAHTEKVVPIPSDLALRNRDWVEGNRRKVEDLSAGRLAYVYMPNTAGAGYTYFNRYYFAGIGREGAVIDERDNGGGSAADYIVDMLQRPLLNWWATREGKPFSTPTAAIFGPKVMIINEYAGSGGDAMPYYFRKRGIGKLVGTTTWGGLVGIYDYPSLIDGGYITAPRVAIFSEDGAWVVENEGVPPDVEVVMWPKEVIAGRDPQLEKAVEILMAEIGAEPRTPPVRPAPPNRVE